MPASVIARDVIVPSGPRQLRGLFSVPGGARGVVLFAHGSGSGRLSERNSAVARTLQAAGLATLLVDLLTDDEERQEARTGHLRFDIGLLSDRLVDATTWLGGAPETAGLPVGYFGASTGAAAAVRAAARLKDRICAVVSRGGRPDLASEDLGSVKAPTLLIVGSRDIAVVPLNQDAYRALKCEKQLVLIPGATHLFEEPGALEEVARLAAEWFAKHLPEAKPA